MTASLNPPGECPSLRVIRSHNMPGVVLDFLYHVKVLLLSLPERFRFAFGEGVGKESNPTPTPPREASTDYSSGGNQKQPIQYQQLIWMGCLGLRVGVQGLSHSKLLF